MIEVKKIKELFLYSIFAVLIGLIVGFLDFIFGEVLLKITEFRDLFYWFLIPFLPIAGLFIVFLYHKFGKNSQKGMSLVFDLGNKATGRMPKRLIPLSILSTWLTHLFGGSAGREGVAVQIGATIGDTFSTLFKIDGKILLITGMAAGFGGLFQTPIAATFFALEVFIAGKLEYKASLSALIGAYTASMFTHFLGLERFSHPIVTELNLDFLTLIKLGGIGICFGLVGRIFAQSLSYFKRQLPLKFENPYKRILIIGTFLAIALLVIHPDRYAGLGTNLITMNFNGDFIHSYDWLLKILFTVLTLAAGFQGGEVTPLFAIGATLGTVLASLLGLPFELVAAFGYVSVFGAATNTFLAPLFIGAEIFGFEWIPYLLPILTLAYLVNGNHSIYSGQLIDTPHLKEQKFLSRSSR